jgi:ferredoxin
MRKTYESDSYTLTVLKDGHTFRLRAEPGANLRKILLDAGLSPYAPLTRRFNCGGRGICATCGVWILSPEVRPTHWHDRLAKRYGYSRLSCQVSIHCDMRIRLDTGKRIWGSRQAKK